MVGYKDREIVKVPLEEVAGKLKSVSPDARIVKEAKMMGICFGDGVDYVEDPVTDKKAGKEKSGKDKSGKDKDK